MTDLKADPETTWMRVKWLLPLGVFLISATALYMQFTHRMDTIESIMERDARLRVDEREAVVSSVNGLRDDMRKVFIETVATRQAQAWIDLARALNRAKYPDIVFPDLPR